ncbi:DUF378 domain-containing protein [Candidatus Microgenomates bacterium]|nr:DUF378 domain-containing protein [Candidatus Microgenomates bacterium]
MKSLQMLAFWLLVVGGLNWGLVGLMGLNIVNTIFASMPVLEQVVYMLVGVSALYLGYLKLGGKK